MMARSSERPQPHAVAEVSDPILQPFLSPSFDPAAYLNSTLPSLAFGSQQAPAHAAASGAISASLVDLSTQTQTLLSQLNAQASRLTTILTQLTDDIVRSGGRLAYEVDVLRSETVALSDLVSNGVRDEISLFVKEQPIDPQAGEELDAVRDSSTAHTVAGLEAAPDEPEYVLQLRMLSTVREQLDRVIKIFGEAMQWAIPASEVSLTSSFISVSGPESGTDSKGREQKARDFAERLRKELADLILHADDPRAGYAQAQAQIDALRDFAQVWKGTAEEKARIKFVESLAKLAEEKLREVERGDASKPPMDLRGDSQQRNVGDEKTSRSGKDVGFLESLQRMHKS